MYFMEWAILMLIICLILGWQLQHWWQNWQGWLWIPPKCNASPGIQWRRERHNLQDLGKCYQDLNNRQICLVIRSWPWITYTSPCINYCATLFLTKDPYKFQDMKMCLLLFHYKLKYRSQNVIYKLEKCNFFLSFFVN